MRKNKLNPMKIAPYLFIAPAILYLLIVTIIPAIMALPISFTDWSALSTKMSFVGFENYKRLLHDAEFKRSLLIMSKFFLFVPLNMFFGLMLALLLNSKIRGMVVFRVIFYSPVITSTVAAAILFDWFYQPSFGLFNSILAVFGIKGIGWINDAKTAISSVMIFKVWKGAGAAMLIYLAGLQDVAEEIKEAASIDGATPWQKFKYITLPLLRPAHIYLLITGIIGVFMIFQETYMLQGPLKSTNTVVNYIYDKGFMSSEMGYASAMSFVLFIAVLIITIIQYKVLKLDLS
ncbi:carbohydrate ABC transporter membrane protein 1, CUT1 family [Clostridium amylolyticum]|uniref:Carbohydrate ABC transporter membrane protein 1, CUT1 family n=1 Tax=Clostridium amylolyticum TaxID=1121298 RepID=A0A1M6GSA5_9CLOT|nr:sugar ABC transporter permease [Clostridium amylolyticum]SHJ12787.1 carbohydrate ABC transporter membrane protein 1, CUT1 family [Clostridium amylolyticum]